MNQCTCPAAVDITFTGHLPDCPETEPRVSRTANNPTRFLNRENARKFLLEQAKQLRPFNKFNRVSEQTLIDINEVVRRHCVHLVKSHPSKGRTL